ncbi:hypothetical protein N7492_005260 [Penicillium capsulatum]|uniref:Uncharacterized protein n=1 Tax=Penicillium capsulatum TaxID=69766 RepID=A0A9W9IFG0_9EURO|nr:hypothetical protein N7492_005260 [Penicillium capsulatum]KAJ6135635.1 hypothetical protein N7512_000795 [Penicillium capsulatum]
MAWTPFGRVHAEVRVEGADPEVIMASVSPEPADLVVSTGQEEATAVPGNRGRIDLAPGTAVEPPREQVDTGNIHFDYWYFGDSQSLDSIQPERSRGAWIGGT